MLSLYNYFITSLLSKTNIGIENALRQTTYMQCTFLNHRSTRYPFSTILTFFFFLCMYCGYSLEVPCNEKGLAILLNFGKHLIRLSLSILELSVCCGFFFFFFFFCFFLFFFFLNESLFWTTHNDLMTTGYSIQT